MDLNRGPRSSTLSWSLLLALGALPGSRAATLARGPYLQVGTPTSIIVRWRTDVATNSRVRYGTAPSVLASVVDDASSTTEHIVLVTGLTALTTYFYSVGSTTQTLAGGDPDHRFVTAPAVGAIVPFRVWVLGDSGTADNNARDVRDAYYGYAGLAPTSFWLMLGDNAYASGLDAEFQAAVFDMYPTMLERAVLWPAFGNAEGNSANSNTQTGPYYDIFTLPKNGEAGGVASGTEAYYAFDFANVHFICLNSTDIDRSGSGAMITWLQQDLAATNQQWVIALWHHAPYSKGSHDSDVDVEMIQMRTNALPVLEQAGVDLVLCGHSHSYERSYLIDSHYGDSSTFGPGNIKDGGDGRVTGNGPYRKPSASLAPHEGAVYTVAGSGGDTNGGLLNHPAMYSSQNVLGSVVLDIDGERLDARFLDSTGIVRDSYTLTKGAPPSAPTAEFAATPTSGVAPLTVALTDQSSGSPTSWQWDLGDGATSSAQNPAHSYVHAGDYTIVLTAGNGAGSSTERKLGYVKVTEATQEVITGAGAASSNAPVVKTWDHATPPAVVSSFTAYGAPNWGVNVAAVDMAGGGPTEVATGPGPGGNYGPQLRGFTATGTVLAKVNFYAYGTLHYGVHPGGGDLDGDGHHEILTAPGPGSVFGPHVRGWNYDNVSVTAIAKISFFAYSTLRYGARVAGPGIDADAYAEIVTGAGPGSVFGPHVRSFDYDNAAVTARASFFAFGSGRYGAAVAGGESDADAALEVIAARGPSPTAGADIGGFDVAGAAVTNAWSLTAFATLGGAEAAAGNLDGIGIDELLVAPGWGAATPSQVAGFYLAGTGGSPIPGLAFAAYAGQTYGVKLAVGETGTP